VPDEPAKRARPQTPSSAEVGATAGSSKARMGARCQGRRGRNTRFTLWPETRRRPPARKGNSILRRDPGRPSRGPRSLRRTLLTGTAPLVDRIGFGIPGGRDARAPDAPGSPASLGLRIALASAAIALLWALPRWPGAIPALAPPAAETPFVPSVKASPAPPAAAIAQFGLAEPGLDPVRVTARVDPRTGLREDTLTRGDVAAIEAPALRVQLTRGPQSGAPPTLFVLMARRAANGPALDRPALAVARTGARSQIRTKFGAVETLDVTFAGPSQRTCTGFVTRDTPFQLDGWLCAPLARPPEPQAIGCMLDALSLVDLADADTTAAFGAGPDPAGACPATAGTEPPGRAGSLIRRPRNKK